MIREHYILPQPSADFVALAPHTKGWSSHADGLPFHTYLALRQRITKDIFTSRRFNH